ncbi:MULTISPECIES: MATE family efflux transporter [Paenibacillus]|uniref:MATE efflux family protein n=2 Tax=Paenibacillus lactis TaxID=228574 RepID=G4HGF8_9BACL|nr:MULTISPECIES: MATE family efflux transporter [Paenibacillus]EHB63831.1 MATE efflux family protein [Paenibacillus lactis 154]MBP1893547.1 putative MATE family efflux protein [Paenibacillus lactis]HAF97979.1 MATE family efflux transporter [Paenibacillus lactis]
MKDMTQGSPIKLIIMFTIPLLIGNLFQQFYNMADTLIVGRTIGVNALAAVGSTGSIMFFIIGFAQGLTAGLSIITAQRFGAKDIAGVRKSVGTSFWISIVFTIVLTILSIVFTKPALVMMNTPVEILDDAYSYLIVINAGVGAAVLFNLLANLLRALGDSRTPLLFLVIASILNIVLDLVFILVFKMGVAGAGLATVISQLFSCLLCLIYIHKKVPLLQFKTADWSIDWTFIGQHMRVGFPMGFQASIIAIGAIILQITLNGLGALSVAAYTAAQKIDMLATQPMNSFGVTMATFAAQNFGANRIDRIRLGVKQCILLSGSFSILVGVLVIVAGPAAVSLFVGQGQEQLLDLSGQYFLANGTTYLLLSLLFIYRFSLQGLGQSFIPTVAGIMELIMRVVAAMFLSALIGFPGACLANPLAWLGALIPLGTAYYLSMKKLSRPAQPASIPVQT